MPAKKAGSAASSASGSDDEEPARRRDKYEQMLYVEHQKIPEFASKWDEFAEMWDDGTYSESDKLSIYYAVLLQTLRKVNAISEQMEHGPILLEMALVKFLSVWLKWGTEDREEPGKFNRGPSKKKAMDPTDIAIFGNNADFLQSITAIDDDKAVQYMKAAGLSVATVTRAAALASKGSKATVVDLQKVTEGLSHSDNIAIGDLDSDSVNKHIAKAKALKGATVAETVEQQYQFLVTHATCYALLVLGFRQGLKVKDVGNMQFLLGHISTARMSAKTMLMNWGVQVDVMPGVDLDKLIDRVLTFKKDPDGRFWLTHYAYVLMGRQACDGRQRLPILGSYAELAEVYKRAFQLMAVLHGDNMFGATQQALFLAWMKTFFEKAAMNLAQIFRTFNDKIFVYLGESIQLIGARFLMDISRESPMVVMAPFYNVHGSEIPLQDPAAGKAYHSILVDRYQMCHQFYSSGIVGHEDCGRGFWGIDPNIGIPAEKNNWNSVVVNPDFHTRLPTPLFEQQMLTGGKRGNERPSADHFLPDLGQDQAPISPVKRSPAPKRAPGGTPPVVIDITDDKKPAPPNFHWEEAELAAVAAHLKQNYGLEGTEKANSFCMHDMRDILFPTYFRGCKQKDKCTYRHGLTATAGGGAFMDGSESQGNALRALAPSYAARIADGTIRPWKKTKKKASK
jgi:hypothetical protein